MANIPQSRDPERFIKAFTEVAEFLRHDEGGECVIAAGAIEELFFATAKYTVNADIGTVIYAAHGIDHAVSLAERARQIIEGLKLRDDCREVLTLDCLVLFFASLLIHDIGMGIPTEDVTSLDELNREQILRKNHDRRSLEFLEEQLLGMAMPRWQSFWDRERKGWPSPGSSNALFLVARVCQSHGDGPDEWLIPHSLATYSMVSEETTIHFESEWDEQIWRDQTSKCVFAAALLLNLVDVCDLGQHRFPSRDAAWNRLLQPSIRLRALSFVHFAGHQVSSANANGRRIDLSVFRGPNGGVGNQFLKMSGPVADAFRWGNKAALVQGLSATLFDNFEGVFIQNGPRRNTEWELIASSASADYISDAIPWRKVNRNLLPDSNVFDYLFSFPLWWAAAADEVIKRVSRFKQGPLSLLNTMSSLRATGLAVEEFMDVDPIDSNSKCYIIYLKYDELPPEDAVAASEIGDSFLSAINVARSLCLDPDGNCISVGLVAKGHPELAPSYSGDKSAISDVIMFPLFDLISFDPKEYCDAIENLWKIKPDVKFIFFGNKNNISRLAIPSSQNISAWPVALKLGQFAWESAAFNISSGDSEGSRFELVESARPSARHGSPSRFLLAAIFRGMGGDVISNSISNWLGRSSNEMPLGFGTLAAITLIDLMDFTGRGVEIKAVREVYDFLQFSLGESCPMCPWKRTEHELRAWGLVLNEGEVLSVPDGKLLGSIRERVGKERPVGIAFQLACRYGMFRDARMVNYAASFVFKERLHADDVDMVIRFCGDENNSTNDRIRVGLFFADFAARVIQEEGGDIALFFNRLSSVALSDDLLGVLVWQMCYRVAQGNIPTIYVRRDQISWGYCAFLGVLEAICSFESDLPISDSERMELSVFLEEGIISREIEVPTLAFCLAFDVCYKYAILKGNRPSLVSDFRQILTKGSEFGFDEVARYFHGVSSPVAFAEDLYILEGWRRARSMMFVVCLDLTPSELARNPTTHLIRSRADLPLVTKN